MKYVIDANGNFTKGPKGGIMIDPENGNDPYEFDALGADASISSLRAEAKEHRTKKAEYKAIIDSIPESVVKNPKAAEEALITVSSLDDKHKADIAKIKGELETSYKAASETSNKKIADLQNQLFNEKVVSRFATSKALEGTIFNKTREVAVSHFRNHFEVDETGEMVGKHKDGSVIYSKTNPGKKADFDECITSILDADPNKESYIAPTGQRGNGSRVFPPGSKTGEQKVTSIQRIEAGLKARNA